MVPQRFWYTIRLTIAACFVISFVASCQSVSDTEVTHSPTADEAQSYLDLGYEHLDRGDLTEAVELLDLAASGFRSALGLQDPRTGEAITAQAVANYYLARYADADSLVALAMDIVSWNTPVPAEVACELFISVAEIRRSRGQYEVADSLFARALTIADSELVHHEYFPIVLNNYAGMFRDRSDFDQAERLLDRSLQLRLDAAEPDSGRIATAYLNLAEVQRFQGRYDEAGKNYAQALTYGRALSANSPEYILLVNQTALNFKESGDVSTAARLYRDCVRSLRDSKETHRIQLAQSLQDLGAALTDIGDFDQAQEMLEESLSIREAVLGPKHPELGASWVELSKVALARRDTSRVAECASRAIEILGTASSFPEIEIAAYSLRARALAGARSLDGAIRDMEAAVVRIEGLRLKRGGGSRERIRFLSLHADCYRDLTAWNLQIGNISEALHYLERGRARAFLDHLQVAGLSVPSNQGTATTDSPASAEADLLDRIASAEAELRALPKTAFQIGTSAAHRREQLQQSIDEAGEDLFRLRDKERRSNPNWSQLVRAVQWSDSIQTIQTQLVPDSGAVLLYSVGSRSSSVIALFGPDAPIWTQELENRSTGLGTDLSRDALSELIDQTQIHKHPSAEITRGFGSVVSEDDSEGHWIESLRLLRDILVPDSLWERLEKCKEVIVVPDGPLYSLPFEALVIRSKEESGALEFWLDHQPVVRYAYSCTALRSLQSRSRSRGPVQGELRILSVLDPELPQESPLPSLRNAHKEWAAIEKALDPTDPSVLAGADATERAVRMDMRHRDVLHFATHAVFDRDRSELGMCLVLAPGDTELGAMDNGALTLLEMYDLELSCRLAVLSACGTSEGPRADGEGVLSLARGMLIAGSDGVIASLWPVADRSTAALIGGTFEEIVRTPNSWNGLPIAIALRNAKRRVRQTDSWSHPFFWAPFIAFGAL